ncbi:Tfp pilus assembly protein FimT/FimU [Thermodesulfobacteriota bacterium]
MDENIRTSKDPSGFTLIELLITIAILGILASVAIPAFSGWLPEYRLRRAIRDLYSNMQLAKMSAIKANGKYKLVFSNAGNGSYVIERSDGTLEKTVDFSDYDLNGNISYGCGNATKSATTAGGYIPSDFVSYNSNKATFNSRGMGSSGYVYLSNSEGNAYAVGTWSAGVIVMKKWNDSTNSWE